MKIEIDNCTIECVKEAFAKQYLRISQNKSKTANKKKRRKVKVPKHSERTLIYRALEYYIGTFMIEN